MATKYSKLPLESNHLPVNRQHQDPLSLLFTSRMPKVSYKRPRSNLTGGTTPAAEKHGEQNSFVIGMPKYPISPTLKARKVSFEENSVSQESLASIGKPCLSSLQRKPTPPSSLCDLLESVSSASNVDGLVASPTSTVETRAHNDDENSPWGQFVDVIPPSSPALNFHHETFLKFRAREDRTYRPYFKSSPRRKTLRKSQTVENHLPDFYLTIPESTSVSEALGNLAM